MVVIQNIFNILYAKKLNIHYSKNKNMVRVAGQCFLSRRQLNQ